MVVAAHFGPQTERPVTQRERSFCQRILNHASPAAPANFLSHVAVRKHEIAGRTEVRDDRRRAVAVTRLQTRIID